MISISRLLCGVAVPGDKLRYGEVGSSEQSIADQSPIVVWNSTKRCNLKCIHCYANATQIPAEGELSTSEAKSFIQDLADFEVPVLLFSGGEPLLRGDILELATYARELGVRPVLSTNGTLITDRCAKDIRNTGFGEVGISLDGIGDRNDSFRGVRGAYALALQAIRNCVGAGLKVSLRFTITRDNYQDIPAIFDLLESLLGNANALLIDLLKQVNGGLNGFPSHRASPLQDRVDGVQQGPIPVHLQDTPTAFNGVVLAMVWWIVDQHDFQFIAVSKLHHPFDELRPKTRVLGAVVQVDH